MTITHRGRSPLLVGLTLVLVALLLAAGAFVTGLTLGGALAVEPSEPAPAPTAEPAPPPPTPRLEVVTCTAPSEEFDLLCEAYSRIKADYVDEVDDRDLVEGAVRGMVEHGLDDPYSSYLPQEAYERALGDLQGEISGIGAEVGIRNLDDPDDLQSCSTITDICAMVIIAPLSGSPAEAAGLRSGDVILAVDGVTTRGSTLEEQVLRVRGEAGTDVTLTIGRGDRELEVTITRAVIDLREIESRMLEDGVGYVRLALFTGDAANSLRAELETLLADGARSIVFDLRDNPGGFIVAARDVASQFVSDGLLFTQESGDDVVEWSAQPDGAATDPGIEVVVLINGGSASASEIVAAALQEHGRATLVGQRTFGKNTVQVWTELSDGGGLRLTTDRWFTPGHGSVLGDGVRPDIEVELPDEQTDLDDDPALDRALELLRD
jgi:carboxyl-terminal processing protease